MKTEINDVVIANILQYARQFHTEIEATQAIDSITNMLAGALSVNNPNFNVDEWVSAAGYQRTYSLEA